MTPDKVGATQKELERISKLIPDPEDQKLVPADRVSEALKKLNQPKDIEADQKSTTTTGR